MADNPQAPTRTPTMTDNLEELEHCKKCIHAGDDCGEHNPTWEQLAEYWRNQANATAREVEGLRIADGEESFLLAYVSRDTKIIGIEHPTEANWQDVYAAHVALRDRLNERLAQADFCPIKPARIITDALAEKATPGRLETAERHIAEEVIECPICNGDGEVYASDYCNIDGKALGVQFYGIGPEFGAHEALWSFLMANLPAIISALSAVPVMKEALEGVIASRDANCFEQEQYKQGGPYGDYWSPAASMVDSKAIAAARQALAALEGK